MINRICKKVLSVLLCLSLSIFILTACDSDKNIVELKFGIYRCPEEDAVSLENSLNTKLEGRNH